MSPIDRRGLFGGAVASLAAIGGARAQTPRIVTAAILGNMPNIHPWQISNVEMAAANLLTYSNLVRINPDGSLAPDAAEALPSISDDGLVYDFRLRPDIRFHNGDRMTADDVLFTYDRYLATARRRQNLAKFIKRVVKLDELGVRFELSQPFAGWLKLLGYEAAIVRRGTDTANESAHGENLYTGSRMAGSGPFIPKSFQADVAAEFEANPGYFGDKPRIGGIKLVRIPDAATQMANLRAGAVDIVSNCPPKDFAPTRSMPGFRGGARPSAGVFYSPLNRTRPPFDNRV